MDELTTIVACCQGLFHHIYKLFTIIVENGREPVAVPGLFALLLVFHRLTDFLTK